MATFLNVGILEYFLPLFSFIFIWVILYAILQKSKLLGGKPILDIIVSILITLVSLLSGSTFDFINTIIPWFVMLGIAAVLVVFASSSFLKEGIADIPPLRGIVMVLSLIIIVWSVTAIFGPVFNPYSAGANPNWETLRTLFHPRILGAIFILLVVSRTIKLIVENK